MRKQRQEAARDRRVSGEVSAVPAPVTSWVLASVSALVIATSYSLALQPGAAEAQKGPAPDGTSVVTLPEVTAACRVHLDAMSGIQDSWQQLHRWVLANGYSFGGPCRELYVRAEFEDQADWVTELQPARSNAANHSSSWSQRTAKGRGIADAEVGHQPPRNPGLDATWAVPTEDPLRDARAGVASIQAAAPRGCLGRARAL